MRVQKESSVEIQWISIAKIKPYERNPRRITDAAVNLVAESIRRFGWKQPLVISSKSGRIVAGHTRYAAALKLKLAEVPAIISTLPEPEEQIYRLVDNRSSELTTWEKEDLASELREIVNDGTDPLGFEDDVALLLKEMEREETDAEKDADEPEDREDPAPPDVCPTCGQQLRDDDA